jgi:hypothetical protein
VKGKKIPVGGAAVAARLPGGSPPIYFTNSVSVVSLGAISVSGRNMDSVCYVRFILPDVVSIEKLLLTNGAGTGNFNALF